MAGLPLLQLLGDLTQMRRVAAGPVFATGGDRGLQGYMECLKAAPGMGTTALARKRLDMLAAQVAADWREAAGTAGAARVFGFKGRNAGGVGHLLQRRLGFAPGGELALGLTVREATRLQMGPEREAKQERQRKYHALATGDPGPSPLAGEVVGDWLGRVWDSGCDNHRKEQAFLLVYDGF